MEKVERVTPPKEDRFVKWLDVVHRVADNCREGKDRPSIKDIPAPLPQRN